MTGDADVLIGWIRTCLIIAAVFTTSFPVLYSFSPWYKSTIGRVLMLQSVAFALVIDATLLFQYWMPSDVHIIFWVNVFLFSFIALASGALTYTLWRTNHNRRKYEKQDV